MTTTPPTAARPGLAAPQLPLFSRFPRNFTWGVATSAFQIEGAARSDGKGPSIWDTFCQQPGAIADGSNGDRACEHVQRLQEDLQLIQNLGVGAYRFSISWPRVQPLGAGAWNEHGLAFYDRLVDGLLARGVQPHITLNHWDLPQALQDSGGGWAARDTVHRFVDYALGIHRRLGDRAASICTHNEPWVIAVLGHEVGVFAPGLKSRALARQVGHHLLVSHGLALKAMRAEGSQVPLGIVLNLSPTEPASASAADAQQAVLDDALGLRWFADPLFKGHYPAEALQALGADAPQVLPGDMDVIQTPIDFLGVNYYSRHVASAGTPYDAKNGGLPTTDMGWEIYPRGLTDLLLRLHRDYPLPPVTITENGAAFKDVLQDGQVHDAGRTAYLHDHISAVADALEQGVPMAGYMVWSLLDNFEWASGYAKRFGIVHVDYESQQRTPKDSARWYTRFLQLAREAHAASGPAAKALLGGLVVGTAALCGVAASGPVQAQGAESAAPSTVPPGYRLVWSDEFNTDGLPDPGKWVHDTGRNKAGWYNNELQYYAGPRLENARVQGGRLLITARRESLSAEPDWGGQRYTASRLITRGKADWTYGFFEVRAKMPCGKGTWPAIWMLGTGGRWPEDGELDIMEHQGHRHQRVSSAVHVAAGHGGHAVGGATRLQDPCGTFHNYQMHWTPEKLYFSVDGMVHFHYPNLKQGAASWPFDKPQFMVLNIAIGGDLGGPVDDGIFPVTMEVDYVRVYQKPGR